jgi:hypothetical protein
MSFDGFSFLHLLYIYAKTFHLYPFFLLAETDKKLIFWPLFEVYQGEAFLPNSRKECFYSSNVARFVKYNKAYHASLEEAKSHCRLSLE